MTERRENMYNADSIKVLKGLEAVRKRPGMYIGNTDDISGLHHMIYEVTDNAVDEALAGYCTEVHITLHKDGSVSVLDNGRGIPVDMHAGEGMSAAQVIMTQLHAGGKFDQKSYNVSGGLHGVGVSVVNALSKWLELVIFKKDKVHFMEFAFGDAKQDLVVIKNLNEYHSHGNKHDELAEISKQLKAHTGTYIRFMPDSQIFSITEFSFNDLKVRYRELAFLNPGLKFIITDEANKKSEIFHNTGGLKSFVEHNAANKTLVTDVFQCHTAIDDIDVTIALAWAGDAYDDHTLCFTNTIPQRDGGTHLQGLRSGLTRAVQKFIPENKTKGLTCTGEDIREGVYCVLSIKMPNPKFSSQTKEKLVSSNARTAVENIVYDSLNRWLEEKPHNTRAVIEKVLEATRAREAARKARDLTRQNKKPDGYISLAGRLSDCSEKDPAKRELYLVEGKSAGGSAKSGRDRLHQAVLALRGKILNVEKSLLNKVLEYEAIRTLITAIGTGLEEECKPEESRYHKIIIMTDADVDGSHIRALLLTFFLKYMYPLIEAGYVYICRTPLYSVKYRKQPAVYIKDEAALSEHIINGIKEKIEILVDGQNVSEYEKGRLYNLAFLASEQLKSLGSISDDIIESGVLYSALDEAAAKDLEAFLAKKYQNVKVHIKEHITMTQTVHVDNAQDIDNMEISEESIVQQELPVKHIDLSLDTSKNETVWEITFEKYALSEKFILHVESFTDDLKQVLASWPHTEIKVNSVITHVTSILHLYQIIYGLQTKMFDISRFKGLGEMNTKDIKETGMDADTRNIELVNIPSLENAREIVNILMGTDVLQRRQFIEENALFANIDV